MSRKSRVLKFKANRLKTIKSSIKIISQTITDNETIGNVQEERQRLNPLT